MKVGDIVRITDGSYSLEICEKGLVDSYGIYFKRELWRILSLDVRLPVEGITNNTEVLNVLVRGEDSKTLAFVLSELCRPYFPEKDITTKYFCDGEDITDKISDETKRNLVR